MSDESPSKYVEVWEQTLPAVCALLLLGLTARYIGYWGVTETGAWFAGVLAMHIAIRYPSSFREGENE